MAKEVQLQRVQRLLREAEGYLDLEMPAQALGALQQIDAEGGPLPFETNFLLAMVYRTLEEHPQALHLFGRAAEHRPDDLSVFLGMAWCYKRVDQVERSIAMMERAYKSHPEEAIVLYNLACYYAISHGQKLFDAEQADQFKSKSLSWLGRALRMDSSYRDLISEETDFDSLRDDPDFQFIASMPDPSGEPD